MVKVIGVRFKKAGKVYYFDPGEYDIKKDDCVIVETVRGVEFGFVVVGPKEIPESELVSPLKPVVRIANLQDQNVHQENIVKSKEAFEVCTAKIQEHALDMKLIDVEYTFDNNKVIFYFTADGRVDFRELVKDLAAVFRTRIELRQIGVRDEAKMMNGIGPCGYKLCCATWLGDFVPVSIKMAKDQSLSLNPTKISGICGRLMCCLRYEYDTYREISKELPKIGERVQTPDGFAIVYSTSILKEKVKVKLITGKNKDTGANEMSEEYHEYGNSLVVRVDKRKGQNKSDKTNAQDELDDSLDSDDLEDFPLEAFGENAELILDGSPEALAKLASAGRRPRDNHGKKGHPRSKDQPNAGTQSTSTNTQTGERQGFRHSDKQNRPQRDRPKRVKRPMSIQLEDQDDSVFSEDKKTQE